MKIEIPSATHQLTLGFVHGPGRHVRAVVVAAGDVQKTALLRGVQIQDQTLGEVEKGLAIFRDIEVTITWTS